MTTIRFLTEEQIKFLNWILAYKQDIDSIKKSHIKLCVLSTCKYRQDGNWQTTFNKLRQIYQGEYQYYKTNIDGWKEEFDK